MKSKTLNTVYIYTYNNYLHLYLMFQIILCQNYYKMSEVEKIH